MTSARKRPYKISLISTHGTGKTTLCYEAAAELKKRGLSNPPGPAGGIPEV